MVAEEEEEEEAKEEKEDEKKMFLVSIFFTFKSFEEFVVGRETKYDSW